MCVDANAGARHAAKQRHAEKDARYRSESLKFFNREAQAVKNQDLAARGFSRSISDDYQMALYSQGQAFRALEQGYASYFAGNKNTAKSFEQGRSRTAGKKDLIKLLQARGRLEAGIENQFGANMQRRFIANRRKYQRELASNRKGLGIRPEYGAPVLMPPSDRLSGALSIASTVASIGSTMVAPDKTLFNALGLFNS